MLIDTFTPILSPYGRYPDFRNFPLYSDKRDVFYKRYKKSIQNLITKPPIILSINAEFEEDIDLPPSYEYSISEKPPPYDADPTPLYE